MAADAGVKIEGSEKCRLDMSSYEDLPPSTVGRDCNGDGKDDYVFVNGSDVVSDDHSEPNGNGELAESNLDSHEKVEVCNANVSVGDRSETQNGGDPGEREGDGERNISELNVDFREKVERGNANVNVGDRLGTRNRDDTGEREGDGERNVSELSVDSSEKVEGEGGDSETNGDDQFEIYNGESDKLDNEIKIDGGELKIENGINIDAESVGDQSKTHNGDDIGELERDGERNVSELNVNSSEKVEGEGGDSETNGDDQFGSYNGESDKLDNEIKIDGGELKIENGVNIDAESVGDQSETHNGDDTGELERDGERNVSELNVDSSEKVEGEGGDRETNGDVQFGIYNGESDKRDNEIKIDGGELKIENGVNVEAESEGKINDRELVMENGEINSCSEDIVDDGQYVESGGSSNVEGDGDVKIRSFELVEGNYTELITNGVKYGEPCIQNVGNYGSSFDGNKTLVLDDDDDKARTMPVVGRGSDGASPDKDDVQNEIAVTGATPLVLCGDTGEGQHLVKTNRHEDKRNEPGTSKIEAGKSKVAEDNDQPHLEEVLVREMEPLDSNSKESKPFEADVGHQLLQGGVSEMHPSGDEFKGSDLPESSEPQSSDGEGKESESLQDDAITINQPSDCLQSKLEPADGENEELGPIKAEAKVQEQGDLDPPEASGNQELSFVNSEAVISEPHQNDEGEIEGETATFLPAESEVQELQTDPLQSDGAENQTVGSTVLGLDNADISKIELTAEVEHAYGTSVGIMKSDIRDKLAVDCETKRVEATSEFTSEVVGNQESSIEGDTLTDQVSENTGSVESMDREIFFEDRGSEKTMAVDEETSLSKIQAFDGAAMDDLDAAKNDLDAAKNDMGGVDASENKVPDDLIIESQPVPLSVGASDAAEGCLTAEDGELSATVDTAEDLPVPSDLDTVKEQGVVEISSCVALDSANCSADYPCPQSKVESGNNALPYCIHDTELQISAADGEVNMVNKSNCISNDTLKPKISFGSFECEAPFSHADVGARPEVSNRSVELASSESKVKPSNGVAILNSEANGVHFSGFNHNKACSEDKVSALPLQGSGADAFNEQNLSTDVVKTPFYYLIRIPKYDDENLREQIRLHDIEVQEKTQSRDSVRVEYQKIKDIIIELKSGLQAAKSEERAARESVKAKKREIDAAQSLINLAKNAMTTEDVESWILNMEHKIQHETLNLNEEKLLVREINQMKKLKGQLHASTRSQEKIQQASKQRVEVEEQLKVLRKEMDALRDNLSKAEQNVQIAKKKYDDKTSLLNELYVQFKSADTVRQKAYEDLLTLKKQLSVKNKYFWNYKDDAKTANDFAVVGDKDSLESHCVKQVEKIMEMWNKDDDFRKEYIRCNRRSTLRRFRTLDGRSLGLDEEPPSLGHVSNDRATSLAKVKSVATVSTVKREMPIEAKKAEDNSLKKVIEQKSAVVKKMAEASSKTSSAEAEASSRTEKEEDKEEVKLTKEEVELARKAEQLRREEEAARLREQRKLEEKAKAKEALERKRRMAEKAQARAEFRARKEAEEREKEREKRAKKKDKKRGSTSYVTESEPAILPESSSETIRELEVTEKPVTVTKKPPKPSPYTKQIKTTKTVPPSMRNRGKKRIKQWMCVIVSVIFVLALFYLGDSNFFRNRSFIYGSAY